MGYSNWDWNNIEGANNYSGKTKSIWDEGDYDVMVTAAKEVSTKNGGVMTVVDFQSTSGTYDSAVVGRFNTENATPKAQEIGRQAIKTIISWDNKDKIDGPEDLVGIGCKIRVKIRSNEQYGDQNDVTILRPTKGFSQKEDPESGKIKAGVSSQDYIPF